MNPTITYLDTISLVRDAGSDGLEYASMSRGMKAHVRSLLAEGVVAGFDPETDLPVRLDMPSTVICLDQNSTYVEMLTEAGLLTPWVSEPTVKPKRSRSVPTPEESVVPVPSVAPQGSKKRFVPGGKQDHPVIVTVSADDRMSALEAQLAALVDMFA